MIETAVLLNPLLWAQATFGSVQLGDPRRTRRAVAIGHAMATEPGASLPKQMHDGAALEATYRFLESAHISYEELIGPHVEMTRQDCREQKNVLLIQDTTEVDYQHHPKTTGLGPVGTGSHQGFLLQTVMAVVPSRRSVLGIAHQEPFLRKPAPQGETKHQRLQRERESQVWQRSAQAIAKPPEGVCWVHVGDRYRDIFPFMYQCRENQTEFLIRAAQDRCVDLFGVEPLEWVLLSSLPTETQQQAFERVEWYRARWMVEDASLKGSKPVAKLSNLSCKPMKGCAPSWACFAPWLCA
jgi:Transposase DNA-binding